MCRFEFRQFPVAGLGSAHLMANRLLKEEHSKQNTNKHGKQSMAVNQNETPTADPSGHLLTTSNHIP